MKSDEQQLKELAADIAAQQRPATLLKAPTLPRIPAATTPKAPTRDPKIDYARIGAIRGYTTMLVSARGKRYADCSLSGFTCTSDAQSRAVERLRGYCQEIEDRAAKGDGVFLFGSCGTGKDHLAMAVAKAFIAATAKQVVWTSGAMLFEKLRDSFDGNASESSVLSYYVRASLLWISDPVPVKGELTQYQAESLYRLIDERYNNRLPVLVTANLEPKQADIVMGPAIARRLRESTMQIHCNWPMHK